MSHKHYVQESHDYYHFCHKMENPIWSAVILSNLRIFAAVKGYSVATQKCNQSNCGYCDLNGINGNQMQYSYFTINDAPCNLFNEKTMVYY